MHIDNCKVKDIKRRSLIIWMLDGQNGFCLYCCVKSTIKAS